MTLRLSDISAQIDGIQQLGAVVKAMRGIAAARAKQARGQLAAVDSYATVIAEGICQALALMPHPVVAAATPVRPALVVFAAEQGFAGAFSERVLDSVGTDLSGSILFLVGTRGGTIVAERGVAPDWVGALPSHSAGVPKLADRITEALYARIAKGEIDTLSVVYARSEPGHPIDVIRDKLLPLDMAKFSNPDDSLPPLLNLASETLLAGLTANYLHAQLCHAALHAFAAENEARMVAMAAARDQVVRQLATLCSEERQVRQEEITAEVIELAAGADANRA
ncbi:MAG: F0F1 ATP synthase subunit gamma [Sphingomonadaceae bacterium]|nr:F0F1 ATP synthase subunit gamma [Sphingomonadaceae bacterium]